MQFCGTVCIIVLAELLSLLGMVLQCVSRLVVCFRVRVGILVSVAVVVFDVSFSRLSEEQENLERFGNKKEKRC